MQFHRQWQESTRRLWCGNRFRAHVVGTGANSHEAVCSVASKSVHMYLYVTVKANSHIPCRSANSLYCVFPVWFTQYRRVWFTHAMPRPCRSHAMPRPCRYESDFSRPRYSAAWERHGMCELPSAVHRRHVGRLPAFGFFRLPCGAPRRLLL
jgi:hypothetical protein